jgi:hypothetical protein
MNPDYYVVFDALTHVKRHHLMELTPYDRDFVCDVLYLIGRGRTLTARQIDHTARIWNRFSSRTEPAHEQD